MRKRSRPRSPSRPDGVSTTDSWAVPLLAALGSGAVGSMTTALITGRQHRKARARRRLKSLDRRLRALEVASAAMKVEVDTLDQELDTDRRNN